MQVAGVHSGSSSWITKTTQKTGSNKGAEIDLLIDRADQTIKICEMKFSINEFKIEKK